MTSKEEIEKMVREFLLAQRTYRTLCYLFSDNPANYRAMWDACQKATGKGPFDWYPPEGSTDLSHAGPFIQFATQYLLGQLEAIKR